MDDLKAFQAWLESLGEDGMKQLLQAFVQTIQLDPLQAQAFQAASDQDKQAQFTLFAYQVFLQLQGSAQGSQATMARLGAKLDYINRLNGQCPEGYEVEYLQKGGCVKCRKKAAPMFACGGKKRINRGK